MEEESQHVNFAKLIRLMMSIKSKLLAMFCEYGLILRYLARFGIKSHLHAEKAIPIVKYLIVVTPFRFAQYVLF